MTKRVVFNEADPGIGVTLVQGEEGQALGWSGRCTECGKPMHWWTESRAVAGAQAHVDAHSPVLIGGDTDALVR